MNLSDLKTTFMVFLLWAEFLAALPPRETSRWWFNVPDQFQKEVMDPTAGTSQLC